MEKNWKSQYSRCSSIIQRSLTDLKRKGKTRKSRKRREREISLSYLWRLWRSFDRNQAEKSPIRLPLRLLSSAGWKTSGHSAVTLSVRAVKASMAHSPSVAGRYTPLLLYFHFIIGVVILRWLGSRLVSVLDSGAEGPGLKLQPRRCLITVLGKLFTPVVPLFTKQRHW